MDAQKASALCQEGRWDRAGIELESTGERHAGADAGNVPAEALSVVGAFPGVAVQFVIKRLEAAAENGGGTTLVAFALVQCHFDQRALGFIEA
jgi:hypothetical protein